MHTIKLRVDEKIYDRLISFFGKFTKQELEIMQDEVSFEESQEYLKKELKEIKSGKAIFFSKDEVNSSLEKVIKKHENKV